MDMRSAITIIESAARSPIESDTGFDDPSDQSEPRRGDTTAYWTAGPDEGGYAGRLKWFVQDDTIHIDRIEIDRPVPTLAFRLLDSMREFLGDLPIDPGMMNADGARLWRLYRERRQIREGVERPLGDEATCKRFTATVRAWARVHVPQCSIGLEVMLDESGHDEAPEDWEVYIDLVETHPQGVGLGRKIMSFMANLADELGVRLTSTPTPLDAETTKEGLIAFNAKFGFVPSGKGPFMVRYPR